MIEEALAWLRLECDAAAQRLGYRREAAALRVRHRRCSAAWRSHLDHTRAALLESARAGGERGGTAVLIGPGPLRDVTVVELLDQFDELRMVDVVIHPEARALARQFPGRVTPVCADITGCIAPLALNPRAIPVHDFPRYVFEGARWIASINLWSQLPLLLCTWLARQGVDEERIEQFGQELLRTHLRELASSRVSFCVIAEQVDRWLDTSGREVDRVDRSTLLRHALGTDVTELQRWVWEVNPAGELDHGQTEVRDVVCYQGRVDRVRS